MSTQNFDPGPMQKVAAEQDGQRWTLVFIRDLAHPPARVWAALTDPGQLNGWSPFTADRDLSAEGPATLTMVDRDTSVPLAAEVIRAEPPTLLEYTWGDDLLRWELAAIGTGTRLTLRHTVSGRDGLPKAAAGWHLCLAVADRMLSGEPVGVIRGQDALDYGWQELHDAYAKEL
jgi:uncharacterized protein YndB with AHSA1/START domain